MSKLEESVNEILGLEGKDKVIDKGLDMAYEYILSDDYSLKDLVK